MNAAQNALSVTSNNIANAQTVDIKAKAIFDDLLYNNTVGSRGWCLCWYESKEYR